MFYKCVISVLYVFYKCFLSACMCSLSGYICITCGYKCVISVLVAIFGIKLIFGLTGLRTNGPSD